MLPHEKETNVKALNDKISIKEIMIALRIEDARTVIKWCKKKSILIVKLGKEKYVNLIDFEIAVDQPFIESLKEKYPQNWKEIYQAYKKEDYITIIDQMTKPTLYSKIKFVAPGVSGNNFIKRIAKRN